MKQYNSDIWFRLGRKVKTTASGRKVNKTSESIVYDSNDNKVLCTGKDEKKYYARQRKYSEEQTEPINKEHESIKNLYNFLVPISPDNYILSSVSDENCPNRKAKNVGSWTSFNIAQEQFSAAMFSRHISDIIVEKSEVAKWYGSTICGFRANSLDDKFRYIVYDVDTSKDIYENQSQRMHRIAIDLHNKHYNQPFASTKVKRICITNISKQGFQFLVILQDKITLREIKENALVHPDVDNIFPDVKVGFRLPFSRHRQTVTDDGVLRYLPVDDVALFVFDDDAELSIDESNYSWILSHQWVPHNIEIKNVELNFTPVEEKIRSIFDIETEKTEIKEIKEENKKLVVSTHAWKNKAFASSRHFIMTGESLTHREGSNKSLEYNELALYAKILDAQSHSHDYIVEKLMASAANRILCCRRKQIENIVTSALRHDNGVTIDAVMKNVGFIRQYCRLMENGVATEYRSSMFLPKMIKYFSSIDVMGLLSSGRQSSRGRKITYDINALAELACDVLFNIYSGKWITNRYVAQIVKNKELNMPSGEEFIGKFMQMLRNVGLIKMLFRGYYESQKSFYEIGQVFQDIIKEIEANIDELANCDVAEIQKTKADVISAFRAAKNPTLVNQVELLISVSMLCAQIEYYEIVSLYRLREKFLSIMLDNKVKIE